jgi:hypothetical protein
MTINRSLLLFLVITTAPMVFPKKNKKVRKNNPTQRFIPPQQPTPPQELTLSQQPNRASAVTYTFSGGRFGDNLVAYLHAKWISYKYKIPLLYKPFFYSDQLMMHELEQPYKESDLALFEHQLTLEEGDYLDFSPHSSTLYIIPYFPECRDEYKVPHNHYPYFEVDWDDEGFVNEIRTMIRPRSFEVSIPLPKNKITVAVHIRKGAEFDAPLLYEQQTIPSSWEGYSDRGYPLKFATDNYYQEQIKRISAFFGHQPLYVYLFTDATNPIELMENYAQALQLPNIEFDCRRTTNKHDMNVLEDFFALTQFDCLIRVDSNFSLVASKLAHYKVQITPKHYHFHPTRGYPVIDKVLFTFAND